MRGRAFLAASVVAASVALPDAASGAAISFTCCAYSPDSVRIVPGDQVTWTGPFGDHPLVSDEGRWTTRNGVNEADGEFTEQFNGAGRFRFFCMIHGGPGGLGMSGTVTVTTNQPPTASIAAPSSAASGESVTFDGSASSDDHGIAAYAWDLDNNGSFETAGQVVSRTYTGPATVTVRLRVTDDNADAIGAETATATKSVTVAAPSPAPPSGGSTPPPDPQSPAPVEPPPAGATPAIDTVKPVVKLTTSSKRPLKLRIRSSEPARAAIKLASGKLTIVMTDTTGNATTVTKSLTLRA